MYPPAGNPVAVVYPQDAQQIAGALRFASADGMSVAVRSGGHGSGNFTIDGALVIDMSRIASVEVDGITGHDRLWRAVGRSRRGARGPRSGVDVR